MYLVRELLHYCNISVNKCSEIHPAKIDFYGFTFVTEGSMTYVLNGQRYELGPYDAIFLPPGTVRERLRGNVAVKYVSFNFTASDDAPLSFPIYMQGIIPKDFVKLVSVFPQIHSSEFAHSRQKLASLLNYMLYELADIDFYGTSNPHIMGALRYIEEHIHLPISLSDVSKHLNFSREYTASLFRAQTGKTVTAYIMDRKMSLAKEMIRYGTESLTEISAGLGFENYHYFSRTFKRHFEISPAQYRSRFRLG